MREVQLDRAAARLPGRRPDGFSQSRHLLRDRRLHSGSPATSSRNAPPSRRLLGFVKVGAGKDVAGDLTDYLKKELVAAAEANIPGCRSAAR